MNFYVKHIHDIKKTNAKISFGSKKVRVNPWSHDPLYCGGLDLANRQINS